MSLLHLNDHSMLFAPDELNALRHELNALRYELNPLCSCLAACYIRYLGAVRMVCVKSRSKVS